MEESSGEGRANAMERLESLTNELGIQVGENEEQILPSYDWDNSFDSLELGEDSDENGGSLFREWLTADPSWNIEDSLRKIQLLKKQEKKKYRGPFTPKNSINLDPNSTHKKEMGVGAQSEGSSTDEDFPYKDCDYSISDPEGTIFYLLQNPNIPKPHSMIIESNEGNQGVPCGFTGSQLSQDKVGQDKATRKAYLVQVEKGGSGIYEVTVVKKLTDNFDYA